ncbi:MAG TPA: peptide transporter, partial [Rhodospirillum rubrum]|nr:peptide transporter [Rhodospirillum rubrum]
APGAVFNIASDERLLMDCPGSGTIVRVEVDLPDDQKVTPLARTALGIPEGAPVLCGAGRPVKFSPRYLAVVAEVLRKVPTSWFLALGVGREGLAALP